MPAKKTAVNPPVIHATPGNKFVYYVPKPVVGAAAARPAKPIHLSKADAATSKKTYLPPKKFITTKFGTTLKANFGKGGALDTHKVIRRIDIVQAAIEGGYGRRKKWTTELLLSKSAAVDLTRYLVHRLQMVTACLEQDTNQAQKLRSFYDRVEASEKTALSFVFGGMGAFLAAKAWLAAGGDPLRSFLHVGIYTKGIDGAGPAVDFESGSTKVPDYLVESASGAWHVFESKGGALTGRWERLCEGLAQLASVPKIGWAGTVSTNAVTCVCVHTSTDAGRALRVTAVDPPGEGSAVDGKEPLVLITGVCRLLLMLETLEQFRALDDQPSKDVLTLGSGWQQGCSSMFGGLDVAIPSRYVQREDEVRQRLAVYFAIRTAIAGLGIHSNFSDLMVGAVELETNIAAQFETPAATWTFERAEVLQRLVPHVGEADFLRRCSEELELEKLAAELMPHPMQDADSLVARILQSGEFVVTSGGMLLHARKEANSDDDS